MERSIDNHHVRHAQERKEKRRNRRNVMRRYRYRREAANAVFQAEATRRMEARLASASAEENVQSAAERCIIEDRNEEIENECAVCMEVYSNENMHWKTDLPSCEHLLCYSCYLKIYNEANPICPFCRVPFFADNVIDLTE